MNNGYIEIVPITPQSALTIIECTNSLGINENNYGQWKHWKNIKKTLKDIFNFFFNIIQFFECILGT
jgi:hypothetical protein